MKLLLWTVLYTLTLSTDTAANPRSKRVLAFRKGSTFFYRMNYKINSFAYTTIFAQATGFKVVWQLPEGSKFGPPRSIRDIHENTKLLYESHGLDGKACLMQNICEATDYVARSNGVMAKILKLLLWKLDIFIIVCITVFLTFCTIPIINSEELTEEGSSTGGTISSLSRQKRYLIFPQGSNVQLVYCLTIGAYGREGDLVVGMTAALAWELPNKVDPKLKKKLHRESRSVIFPKIEAFLQSTGLDGKSCVMRALCEAGQRSESEIGKGTFVQELLHAIFTLPNDDTTFESIEHKLYDYAYQAKEDCTTLYSTCQYSIKSVLF